MKIRSVEAQLFHADGWTDGRTEMPKLIAAFRNFSNVPQDQQSIRKCSVMISNASKNVTQKYSCLVPLWLRTLVLVVENK